MEARHELAHGCLGARGAQRIPAGIWRVPAGDGRRAGLSGLLHRGQSCACTPRGRSRTRPRCFDQVSKLLEKDPEQRLAGLPQGMAGALDHPYPASKTMEDTA